MNEIINHRRRFLHEYSYVSFRHSSRYRILHLVVSYRTNQPHYVCMVPYLEHYDNEVFGFIPVFSWAKKRGFLWKLERQEDEKRKEEVADC